MNGRFKLLMAGDSGCGKTSLMVRFADGTYKDTFISTIGIDFKICTVVHDGKNIKLHVWDTAGQERFRNITTSYYRGSHCVLLTFSLTDAKSFSNLTQRWMADIKQHSADSVLLVLVGAKADDLEGRCIAQADIDAFCHKYNIMYFETSAKTGKGVDELFKSIVAQLVVKHPECIHGPGEAPASTTGGFTLPSREQQPPPPVKNSFCSI